MRSFLLALALTVVSLSVFAQEKNLGDIRSDYELDPQIEPNIERKRQETEQLVKNAVIHINKTSLEIACNDFIHKPIWRKGELFVYVFDKDGFCLAHGDDTALIWKNIRTIKGISGRPLIEEMFAVKKSAEISYIWNHAYANAYVERITKNGEEYIIGSHFFPESDEFLTKRLVQTAVASFYERGKLATFALISNPRGPFNKGDIYMFAYDFKGIVEAHGQQPSLVGENLIDLNDSRGKKIIRELIQLAKTKGSGWVEYVWRNEFKRSYVEKVKDPKTGKQYLLAAGYYPNLTLRDVESYVKRAITYLKVNGAKDAFAEFSNVVGTFARAGLGIFVYDFNGKCLANGEDPSYVGQNLIKVTDQEGRYYIRRMIEVAKKFGRGFVSYRDFNAQAIAYIERVDTPIGSFVIGATYFPDSKVQSVQTMVNRAVETIKEVPKVPVAFNLFTSRNGNFIHGDTNVFVYDIKGTRLVYGLQTTQIWHNFIHAVDQHGKPTVGNIIATAVNGGGWFQYKTRNADKRVYVKAIEKVIDKQTRTYVVGSGFFL